MSTWISNPWTALAAMLLILAGCAETAGDGEQRGSFLTSRGTGPFAPPNHAMPSAGMMNGAILLAPPDGYCIDRRSFREDFALLASCDALGAPEGYGAVPPGLMTVAVVPVQEGEADDAMAAWTKPDGARMLGSMRVRDVSLSQVTGGVSVPGAASDHWRGVARIGPYVLGVAAYRPARGDGPVLNGQAAILALVAGSRAATQASRASVSGVVTKNLALSPALGLFD